MKTRNIENNLAVFGALIVLVGVSFAAGDAFGAETADVTSTAIAIHDVSPDTTSGAEKANKDAAAKAAESLAIENSINLEIKLESRTSTLIAANSEI